MNSNGGKMNTQQPKTFKKNFKQFVFSYVITKDVFFILKKLGCTNIYGLKLWTLDKSKELNLL
jgi:hypothetical protein